MGVSVRREELSVNIKCASYAPNRHTELVFISYDILLHVPVCIHHASSVHAVMSVVLPLQLLTGRVMSPSTSMTQTVRHMTCTHTEAPVASCEAGGSSFIPLLCSP